MLASYLGYDSTVHMYDMKVHKPRLHGYTNKEKTIHKIKNKYFSIASKPINIRWMENPVLYLITIFHE